MRARKENTKTEGSCQHPDKNHKTETYIDTSYHHRDPTELPKAEIWVYSTVIAVYTGVLVKAVYDTSKEMEKNPGGVYELGRGWSFLRRKKDWADNEWAIWSYVASELFTINIIHIITSILAHHFVYEYRRHVWLTAALCSMTSLLGYQIVLFIVFKCFTFYLVTYLRNEVICWILGAGWMMALNYRESDWLSTFLDDPNKTKFGLVFFSTSFLALRCISYSIERVRHFHDKPKNIAIPKRSDDTTNLLKYEDKKSHYNYEQSKQTGIPSTEKLEQTDLHTSQINVRLKQSTKHNQSYTEPQESRTTNFSKNRDKVGSIYTVQSPEHTRHPSRHKINRLDESPSEASEEHKQILQNPQRRKFLHNDSSLTFSFFDLLVCAFYIPTYYTGPTITYRVFQTAAMKKKQPYTTSHLTNVAQHIARCIFWMVFLNVSLHYFYVHSIVYDPDLLRKVSLWTLGGVVYLFSEAFYIKYLVTYGLPGALMKLDQLIPPDNPRCIAGVVHFSQYWRYFDPGLHHFFKTYVYIPLGGSHHGLPRQLLATALTFTLVFYWHGASFSLFMWAMYNCVGVVIEVGAGSVARWPAVRRFEIQYLGARMTRRMHALLYLPLYIFCIHAIFIFFTDITTGWIFVDRFILKGSLVSWLLTALPLYCLIILSSEFNQRRRIKNDAHAS